MPEEKRRVRQFSQERFQEEVARELGIDLNPADEDAARRRGQPPQKNPAADRTSRA